MCLCVCDDVRHILLKDRILAPRQQRQNPCCFASVKTHQRKNAARLKSGTDNRTVPQNQKNGLKLPSKKRAKTSKKSPKNKKKPSIFDQNQQKASKKLTKSETTNTAKTDSSVPMTCQQPATGITESGMYSLILPSRHVDDEDKGVDELSTPRWKAVHNGQHRGRRVLSLILPGRHVDVEDKGVVKHDTLGGEQFLVFINASFFTRGHECHEGHDVMSVIKQNRSAKNPTPHKSANNIFSAQLLLLLVG